MGSTLDLSSWDLLGSREVSFPGCSATLLCLTAIPCWIKCFINSVSEPWRTGVDCLSCAIPVVCFLVRSQKSLHTASLFSLLCTLCLSSFSLAFCAKNVVGEGGTTQEMPLLFSNDISSCIWMGEFEEGESIKSVESCSAAKSNWYILALETVEPFLLNFGPFLKFRFRKSRGKSS